MTITAQTKPFHNLTPYELYAIMRLRIQVFVVEQNCPFQDADNLDQACLHLLLSDPEGLVAYARLVPPGLIFPEGSIGRIITSSEKRGTGLGQELMRKAIEQVFQIFGKGPIRISAQVYAKDFYQKFGFEAAGDIYEEDGIPHIKMVRPALV